MNFTLTRSAFLHEERIPSQYTCEGEDISPSLEWSDVPEHARILVELKDLHPEFVGLIEDADKGAFTPDYAEVVSSTPQEILDAAAAE